MTAPHGFRLSVFSNVENTIETSLIALCKEDAIRNADVAKVFVVVDHWEARIIVPLELN